MNARAMAQTLAEKIICRAAGRETLRPGEIVTCRVDLAMVHDSSGPRRLAPMLERLGVGVWDPDRLVVITDHFVPAFDAASVAIQELTRDWVAAAGVRNFYDMQGVCHIVLPERGHLRPGMFVVGGDSHSCTGGAFGCFMFGVGATEPRPAARQMIFSARVWAMACALMPRPRRPRPARPCRSGRPGTGRR